METKEESCKMLEEEVKPVHADTFILPKEQDAD